MKENVSGCFFLNTMYISVKVAAFLDAVETMLSKFFEIYYILKLSELKTFRLFIAYFFSSSTEFGCL